MSCPGRLRKRHRHHEGNHEWRKQPARPCASLPANHQPSLAGAAVEHDGFQAGPGAKLNMYARRRGRGTRAPARAARRASTRTARTGPGRAGRASRPSRRRCSPPRGRSRPAPRPRWRRNSAIASRSPVSTGRPERSSLQVGVGGGRQHQRVAASRSRRSGAIGSGITSSSSISRSSSWIASSVSRYPPSAMLVVAQHAAPVPQVERRPDLVAVQLPDLVVGVERDRELDLRAARPPRATFVRVLAEVELRRVDADHAQARIRVAAVPLLQVRQRADRVQRACSPRTTPAATWRPSSVPSRTNGAFSHSISGGKSGA